MVIRYASSIADTAEYTYTYTIPLGDFSVFRRERSGRNSRLSPIHGVLIGLSGPV